MEGFSRDDLPTDAENYEVWCERCQRRHNYYAMTRESYDRMIAEKAQQLADAIDAEIAQQVYGVKA